MTILQPIEVHIVLKNEKRNDFCVIQDQRHQSVMCHRVDNAKYNNANCQTEDDTKCNNGNNGDVKEDNLVLIKVNHTKNNNNVKHSKDNTQNHDITKKPKTIRKVKRRSKREELRQFKLTRSKSDVQTRVKEFEQFEVNETNGIKRSVKKKHLKSSDEFKKLTNKFNSQQDISNNFLRKLNCKEVSISKTEPKFPENVTIQVAQTEVETESVRIVKSVLDQIVDNVLSESEKKAFCDPPSDVPVISKDDALKRGEKEVAKAKIKNFISQNMKKVELFDNSI